MFLKFVYRALTFPTIGLLSLPLVAEEQSYPASGVIEEVFVTGGIQAIRSLSGSATLIKEDDIALFDTTDVNSMLTKIPGVYIRQEDGFGLRPNINLRGTSSDRSSKITIMEDGILIGPAPYSAPAAYYVPNVSRMQALEVSKGPAAIRFGPHTVGGAINFVTRSIEDETRGELGLSLGSDGLERYRGFVNKNSESFGFWLDALRYGSDGFKQLENGGDTGFVRNDINAKFAWRLGEPGEIYQEFNFKLGYADEDANETYLGVTDADFDADPNQRYAASELDHFDSQRQQVQLIHTLDVRDNYKFVTRAYHHRFERSWNKFDGIINGPGADDIITGEDLREIFANPELFADEIQLLRGELDSSPLSEQRIDVTDNDRSFEVSGIDSQLSFSKEIGNWNHDWVFGLRLHNDQVERDHQPLAYLMQGGSLVLDVDNIRAKKALNTGEATALSVFVADSIQVQDLRIDLGLRYESIDMDFEERATGVTSNQSHTQDILLPGLGVFYSLNNELGFLVGVNRGFSPKAPSAGEDVDPETSVNYELGMRYFDAAASLELIAFFSDYKNLLGRCRASDICSGEEFNGGEADVYGLELNSGYRWSISQSLEVPLQFTATYTRAEFKTSFSSSFSQWGDVEKGDELPYLPDFQGRIDVGLEHMAWSVNLALKYVDKMREEAGQGVYEEGNFTESLLTVDLSANYFVNDDLTFKLIVENVSDQQEIVSRRPFGARPNLPRTVKAAVEYSF